MHLILTGATGLVGSAALDAMLNNAAVSKISILSRRAVPMAEGIDKVHVIQHSDFNSYDSSILEQLQGAKGCVWALGVSQTDVSKENYVKITHDYTMNAASAFSSLSPAFNFVFVSGEGATHTPGAMTPIFGRVKGQTELELLALAKQHQDSGFNAYALRPAGVDPQNHAAILPFIPKLSLYKRVVYNTLFLPMRPFFPKFLSPTKELGEVLVRLAMGDGQKVEGVGVENEGRIVSNVGFRRLAGLSH